MNKRTKRRVKLTENQLRLIVRLIQENEEQASAKAAAEKRAKEMQEKEDLKRFEALRLKKLSKEKLNDEEKEFLKDRETAFQKFLNLMRADPEGAGATRGLANIFDVMKDAGGSSGSVTSQGTYV